MKRPTIRSRLFSCIIFALFCSIQTLYVIVIMATYFEMLTDDTVDDIDRTIREIKNTHPLRDCIRRGLSFIRRALRS